MTAQEPDTLKGPLTAIALAPTAVVVFIICMMLAIALLPMAAMMVLAVVMAIGLELARRCFGQGRYKLSFRGRRITWREPKQ